MKISLIYPEIYNEKFGNDNFVYINSSFLISKKVYLDIDDLNNIEDLGAILDFFRNIEKERDIFKISIFTSKKHTYCKCSRNYKIQNFCINCKMFFCIQCSDTHNSHNVEDCYLKYKDFNYYQDCSLCKKMSYMPMTQKNDKIFCDNCYKQTLVNEKIIFTKPVIGRINLYEWIPINMGYLENRNPESHLYNRKMIKTKKKNSIELKLVHIKASKYYDYNEVVLYDIVYRILDHYKIPPYVDDKIVELMRINSGLNWFQI